MDQGKTNTTGTRRDEAGEAEPLPSPLAECWGAPWEWAPGDSLLPQTHLSTHPVFLPVPHMGGSQERKPFEIAFPPPALPLPGGRIMTFPAWGTCIGRKKADCSEETGNSMGKLGECSCDHHLGFPMERRRCQEQEVWETESPLTPSTPPPRSLSPASRPSQIPLSCSPSRGWFAWRT